MGDPEHPDETRELHHAYTARTPEQVRDCYDQWAADYEAHMSGVGYAHPAMVAATITRHLAPGAGPLLDAGAGTGIMADLLVPLGYPRVVGIDASEKMLAAARAKERYEALHRMVLGEPLALPDAAFAAVVAAGVFTEGHAPLEGLDELIRVTRPGGLLVLSIARAYLEQGQFDARREALEHDGHWRLVEASERYNSTPLGEPIPARVYALERAR